MPLKHDFHSKQNEHLMHFQHFQLYESGVSLTSNEPLRLAQRTPFNTNVLDKSYTV